MPERLKRMCLFIIYIDKNGPFLPHLQCCVQYCDVFPLGEIPERDEGVRERSVFML